MNIYQEEDEARDCGDCKNFSFSDEDHRFHCSVHDYKAVYKTDLQPCEWFEEDTSVFDYFNEPLESIL